MIIVGATHGATAGYRADADRAYAEAIKYTPNVVKVYSPNATWAKVKAAAEGASIVIYMGHGNGWPSPYTYDPKYTTKDGFGLNATAGAGDYNNKYYGEPYIATLDLAPGAVVILNHLCYASGNSEPGNAEPDRHRRPPARRQLRRRLPEGRRRGGHRRRARGRRAVPPGPVHDPPVDRGRVAQRPELPTATSSSFPSARTPGRHRLPGPDSRPPGFYRSLVVQPGRHHRRGHRRRLRRHRASTRRASSSPATPRSRPTARSCSASSTLTPDAEAAAGRLPAGHAPARRRQPAADHGRPATRWSRSRAWTTRSSPATSSPATSSRRTARRRGVRGLDGRHRPFSPNGDGVADTATICGQLHRIGRLDRCASRTPAAATLQTATGTGSTFSLTWDGTLGGGHRRRRRLHRQRDGRRRLGQRASSTRRQARRRHRRARRSGTLTPAADPAPWFSPNGDG